MALAIFALALAISVALSDSGLPDLGAQLWRPCTIYEKIQAANLDERVGSCPAGKGADVIEIHEDITLWARLPSIRSEITIEGKGHTISGDGKVGLFSVLPGGKLRVENARLIKGAGNQFEGAIHIDGGDVRLVNVTVSDSAIDNGSAFRMQGGRLHIRDSAILGNSEIRSRAIFNQDGTVSIVNATFEGFAFDFPGGAILNSGTMNISQSVFRNNLSALSGGAIDNFGELEILETIFTQNSARTGGGAIDNYKAELKVVDSEFRANHARLGGAIRSRGTPTRIEHSNFASNSAEEGGALYAMDGWLIISESSISLNTALKTGGGIHAWGGSLRVADSDMHGNSATEGGGIYSQDARLNVSESSISENRADRGGGVYYTGGVFTLNDSVFSGNCAYEWGASLYSDTVELDERNNTFEDSQYGFCDD